MSFDTAVAEFELCGPLPTGVTVLEASAGTGKTYTIAALAARYVAEGTPLHQLLLITFTRIATGELRDRVRERLVSCEEQLSGILSGAVATSADEVVRLLATGPRDQVALRRDRLLRALSEFDAATIATTHSFCQEVLAELGTVGDLEPGTEFVENVSDLLEEVVDDLYVRRFQKHGEAKFKRAEAMRIAQIAVDNPTAPLEPRATSRERAAMRYRLAVAVREELELRKRRMAIMTYDDLLTRLAQTLRGDNGLAAAERLRARYRVVLVDEFQDTDRVQWQILHRAFVGSDVTLVLIADPKQAIYAFRGADVYAYLVAARSADTRATLLVNRRSDQRLVDAYDALFGEARLGHPEIVYRRVRAASEHQAPRLLGAPTAAALRVRVVLRDEPTIEQTKTGLPQTDSVREHIACDLAADVVALLSSGASLERRAAERAEPVEPEPLLPGHIAVLVRSHAHADLIRAQLEAADVPVVINGAGSVFSTGTAEEWLTLLEALDRPAVSIRARTAALTLFIGWSPERIATAAEEEWEGVHRRLHRWGRVLRERGVAEMTEAIMIEEALPARVLAGADGERRLTDLRHIGQLLHRTASAERLGATALRGWLAQRIEAAQREEGEEEQTRRLESDADAVQVLTIHRSKGLEFPVVYLPFLWAGGFSSSETVPVTFHDAAKGDDRTIDVGLEGRSFETHQRQHRVEERGEDLRLAYVALTRAKHQAVLWWAGAWNSQHSPLGRLLLAKDAKGTVAPDGGSDPPPDKVVVDRLRELVGQTTGCIKLERSQLGAPVSWTPPPEGPVELLTAAFDRDLDLRWRRTSYSDITAGAHDPLVASEPEEPGLSDEPEAGSPGVPVAAVGDGLDAPSPLGALPVGVRFGTFVHRVLEATDFAAADLGAELAGHVAQRARRTIDPAEHGPAVAGLRAAIETPLGELAGRLRLCDVPRSDRLDELAFELPLAGGEDPTGQLTLAAIGGALREHLPHGDPLALYAARLDDPALRSSVRGFLTGSLDLVIRLAGPRFAIVDYKTNWLGPVGEPMTLRAYEPGALRAEMSRAHYGLQALLYTVALHRYLRWRLPDYDADRHLAGVLYLFLRGMAGAQTPVLDGAPCGVFGWRPPGAVVLALSDVLDQGAGA